MSRNGTSRNLVPLKGPQWSNLRQFSRSGYERPIAESPASPRSVSTHSTVKEAKRSKLERRCTVTVNEGYTKDEVLLNFDLVGVDVRPGTLMSIVVVKDDVRKASSGGGGNGKQGQDNGCSKGTSAGSNGDSACCKYVFVAKDMPQELKARLPDVGAYVVKHIADAFGMKKGSQVLLSQV